MSQGLLNLSIKSNERLYTAFLSCALLYVLVYRFMYIGDYAATWDQVDFALALERFDLAMMQPHFPGYPYFILGGMIVHGWIDDPVRALVLFNKIMLALSVIPMLLIATRYFSVSKSLLAVLFWQTLIYVNMLSSLPMSDASAISMLWWFLWSLLVALERQRFLYQLLPLFMFSLVMGIRLSYVAFGAAILALWWLDWRRYRADRTVLSSVIRLFYLLVFAVLLQLIWVGALVAAEGSLSSFLSLAFSFTGGHFSEWGGAVTERSMPFLERCVIFVKTNIWEVGLAGQSIWLGLILLVGIAAACFSRVRMDKTSRSFYFLWTLGTVSYLLWALFAQNIDKPRHIAPLVIFIAFWLMLKLLNAQRIRYSSAFIVLVIVFQIILGQGIMKEQEETVPATYQLATYLESLNERETFVVFTWEETRVMQFLGVSYPHERLWTHELFQQRIQDYSQHKIYVTNHLLEGFKQQGIDLENKLEKEAEFFYNDLFEPGYEHIILYEWKR
jgi:hypothetical protein